MTHLVNVNKAKLISKALQEAFPGILFAVRSERCNVVDVAWEDGPSCSQVKCVTDVFEGATCKGVDLKVDWIRVMRTYSFDYVGKAIDNVYQQYKDILKPLGIAKPTPNDFFNGDLIDTALPTSDDKTTTMQVVVRSLLEASKEKLEPLESTTLRLLDAA